MATNRTLNFLPEIFRTDANKKFLAATVDQLISEPNFKKVNGYIGRRVTPTFKPSDNYIGEPSTSRQNYQLEPCVVVKDVYANSVDFFSSYPDLLQKIEYYGGIANNHDRLFRNEFYTFDGCFDFDKFINFNNYYWMPDGPQAVNVFAGSVDNEGEYRVTRNLSVGGFNFSSKGIESNPVMILSRGGTYRFQIDHPEHRFWIQSEPGVSGKKKTQPNISTRDVLGVLNNGTDQGTVTFRVPQASAQDKFTSMTMAAVADLATDISYVNMQDHSLRQFLKSNPDGIDGYRTPSDLDGKFIIFINEDIDDVFWTNNEIFDVYPYDVIVSETVPVTARRNLWRIQLIPSGRDHVIKLTPSTQVEKSQKVFVRRGKENASREFYTDFDGIYQTVPNITANLDRLFYQDSRDPSFVGEIRIVDPDNFVIDVNNDILDEKNYTSPNGVEFTNGLKIRFDNKVIPSDYRLKDFYVEGVGKSIRLIGANKLINPEPYAGDLETLDYLTINRGSSDLNAWSRSNRWFHIDVLKATAAYNKTIGLPNQQYRANRPIIEFDADLQLFNFGRQGLPPVDYLDFYVTDAFSQIEGNGKQYDALQHYVKDEVVVLENKVYRARIDLQQIPGNDNNWQNLYSLPIYSGTQAYRQDNVVRYLDRIYRALAVTSENLPTNTTYWEPIIWNRENIDEYDAEIEYQQFDAVYYNNEYYACISPNGALQISPDITTTWKKVNVFVDYSVGIADTILENQYAAWQGRLYRAVLDIKQDPRNNDLYWQSIIDIVDGKSVIFAGDEDPMVRNIVYRLSMEDIGNDEDYDENPIRMPHLTPSAFIVESNSTVIALEGLNTGLNFWYDGNQWKKGLQKSSVNQAPLFDVVDENNISFGNLTRYPNSTFGGSRIFSYKTGTGKTDTVLGFPLSYRNFNSVGDIEFSNDFDNSLMSFLDGTREKTIKVNSGYLLNYINRDEAQTRNIWIKAKEKSHQYQIFSHVFDGTTNYFEVDVSPNASQQTPFIKVFVNNELIKEYQYVYEVVGVRQAVRILSSLLTVGAIVDIMIYSDSTSELGHYEVPPNLDYNSQNADFEYLTLGQLKNHIAKLVENTRIANQTENKFTRFRDVQFKNHGGTILQHASPSIYSNLFLIDNDVNFVDSIDLAAREYTKFKNKFLEAASKLTTVDSTRIPETVDEIIKTINAVKNSSFPWHYSDMVPYGDNRREYLDVVINPELRQFDLPMVFDDQKLSNRAVLVYVNNKQLVKDQDYYFPQDRTAVIISEEYPLEADDFIKIVDYLDTNGCYVPETPSKLGLCPKFVPGKLYDNTYRDPIFVIQGHDGSMIPSFEDYRDDLLVELETRIYNNIKLDYYKGIANIHDFIPGKFRDTGYSLAEFDRVLSRSFLKWAGSNQVDYTTNTNFVANDSWTWNYSKYRDTIDGGRIPGAWRAIFKYFYDTDRPNTHPWEMLGFSSRPDWWNERYGAAPYTGGNLLLWQDLAQGYIHAGPRQGYDQRYARSSLLSIIPVDEYGALRPPSQFAVSNFNSSDAGRAFSVGNQGPAESAWRRSSDYPFALQRTMALTQPAFYFGSLFDVKTYNRNSKLDQLVISNTLRRVTPGSIKIHGDVLDGQTQLTAGYLNWIRDYVKNLGRDPATVLRHRLDNLDVNLGYRAAGYTDKNYIKVLAEQSSPSSTNDSIILPDENYTVHLNKSSPLKKIIYSAVIVEKTNNGYTVSGYDVSNPYFTIIPSLANNNAYVIDVIKQRGVIYRDYQNKKVIVPYGFEFTSRQQVVDFLISYGRYLTGQGIKFTETESVLASKKDWVLSAKEFLHWSQQGWSNGNLIILSPIKDVLKVSTPLGVVDHVENTINGSKILDQQFSTIKNNQFTVVRSNNEFKISVIDDRSICFAELEVVQFEHVLIFDNSTVFNDIIYKPELGNRQFRLKLVGSKTNDWSGELNPPGFVYNASDVDPWLPGKDYKKGSIVNFKEQYYTALENIIAVTEFNQAQWRLIERSAIKTGLLPNFAYNAQKFEDIYDIDNAPDDSDLLEFSAGLIGFRERTYLSDFSLDNVSQVKFYQGFIKDKGTRSSVDALTTAKFNNVTSGLDLYEEWALRVGEYGAVESDAQIEIVLNDTEFTNDPSTITLTDNAESAVRGTVSIKEKDLYRRTSQYKKDIFFNRSQRTDTSADIATAGFVNLEDISGTVFDIRNFSELDNLLPRIGKGFKLWVARDFDNDWNVYRISETDNNVSSAIYDLDDQISVTFDKPHELKVGDIFVIKNLDSLIDGFYQVAYVTDLVRVSAKIYKNQSEIKKIRSFSGNGVYLVAKSMRTDSSAKINQMSPLNGWLVGDCVWADNIDHDGHWGVYEKTDSWKYQVELPVEASDLIGGDRFGHAVKINSQRDLIVVSSPESGEGNIKTFVKLTSGEFKQSSTFRPTLSLDTAGFGGSIDLVDYRVAVGASASKNNQGRVFVYNFRTEKEKFDLQVLFAPDANTGDQFGHSVSLSQDLQWLYVGAPGKDTVYVYHYDTSLTELGTHVLTTELGQTDYVLNFSVATADSIKVTSEFGLPDLFVGDGVTDTFTLSAGLVGRRLQVIVNNQLMSASDYTIDGDTLTLNSVPDIGNVIVARINQPVLLQPNVDYTVTEDGELSLSKDPGLLSIEVQQAYHYKLVDELVGTAGSQFGRTVKTNRDGSVVVVGAPNKTITNGEITYTNTGAGYIYTRRIEEQSLKANRSTYLPSSVTMPFVDLFVNGVLLHSAADYTLNNNEIVLLDSYEAGQTLIISTSQFDLLQEISSPDLVDQGNFGFSLDMDHDAKSIYIGAPNYYDSVYSQGKVYRFTMKSKYFGISVSQIENPVISAGSTIYVNRVPVTFTAATDSGDTTARSMAIDINRLPGITADVDQDGRLVISTVSKVNKDLQLTPAGDDALEQIAFDAYVLDQEILEPDFNEGSFGSNIVVDSQGETVSITGKNSSLTQAITFDGGLGFAGTTFDIGTTLFNKVVNGSGAVYLFELINDGQSGIDNTGSLIFANKLSLREVYPGDEFGFSVGLQKDSLVVSSPGFDPLPLPDQYDLKVDNLDELSWIGVNALTIGTRVLVVSDISNRGSWSIWTYNGAQSTDFRTNFIRDAVGVIKNTGSVHLYTNPSSKKIWDLKRKQEPVVDLDSVNRLLIYNRDRNTIIANLDYIDPVKGKILGIAEQDIDFKTELDPAIYTNGTSEVVIDQGMRWGEQQVGMIWWNLSKVRYLDYEQDDLIYRTKNWGAIFPGSEIEICEWVSSSVPPEQYATRGGSGIPKYNNQAYVVDTVIDSQSGILNPRYYFWVTGKQDVSVSRKRNSCAAIADIIENPNLQGIPYVGILKSNALALYGINDYLTGNSVILQIDYANAPNSNIMHTEFELVQENRRESEIPNKIVNKMVDSLAGIDRIGNVVPDPTLKDNERVGISYRPRQNMFRDRARALRSVIDFVNRIFLAYPVVRQFNTNGFFGQDPVPTSSGYDRKVSTVDELGYIETSEIEVGYRVLIENDSTNDGLWTVWRFNGSQFVLSRIQSYKTNLYWEYRDWYADGFDPSTKITYTVDYEKDIGAINLRPGDIIDVRYDQQGQGVTYRVQDDFSLLMVALENGTIQFLPNLYDINNDGMGFDSSNFDNVRYDKTPGVEIRQILESIRKDIFAGEFKQEFNRMFFVMINYLLTEQKHVDWIFKTSFVNIVHKLRKLDQYPSFVRDNQDYYIDYINEVKPYRTQIREYLLNYDGIDVVGGNVSDFDLPAYYDKILDQYRTPNGERDSDEDLLSNTEYRAWNQSHQLVVDRIIIENPGSGYTVIPEITIEGGGGRGAKAIATIDFNGLTSVVITNPGRGYTSTPRVVINGNGSGAVAYPLMRNVHTGNNQPGYNLVRSLNSNIKLDRIAYDTQIPAWSANSEIFSDRVSYFNDVYKINEPNIYVVPVQLSGIETFDVELISTFQVENTDLTPSTVINLNNIEAVFGIDYSINMEDNTITLLDPQLEDEVSIRYVGDEGEDLYETFLVETPRVYQLNKSARVYLNDLENIEYQVYLGDQLQPMSQYEFSEDLKTLEFIDYPTPGLQIKVNVENDVIFTVSPEDVPGAIYDSESDSWSAIIGGKVTHISDINDIAIGQRVRGSGINDFNNTVSVQEKDSGTIRLQSETKTRTTRGRWEGKEWVPGNEITYRDPAVLVQGKNTIELLYFVSPIVTERFFDYRLFTRVNGDEAGHAIDRAVAYYQPVEGGEGQDPSQVIKGITYPGVRVQGLPFSQDEELRSVSALIDSHISSRYQDIALGTRPEDITITGGAYVDLYSSHAPEELVPGIIFDSLNMQVFTKPITPWSSGDDERFVANGSTTDFVYTNNLLNDLNTVILVGGQPAANGIDYVFFGNTIVFEEAPQAGKEIRVVGFDVTGKPLAYRIFHDMAEDHNYYRIAEAYSTTLAQPLTITDTQIRVVNASVLSPPTNRRPGVLFMGGEMITFLELDTVNNLIKRIRRGANGTGAPALHPVGQRVVDAGEVQRLPGQADTSRWLNSSTEFGFREIGDFDYTGYDEEAFDILIQISDTELVPTEQARFLAKSPGFNR